MKTGRIAAVLTLAAAALGPVGPAAAQQITGTPGSPSATDDDRRQAISRRRRRRSAA